jgi:hypothetical protein
MKNVMVVGHVTILAQEKRLQLRISKENTSIKVLQKN